MKALTISVIICTRNRLNDLLLCLKSIAQQTIQPQEIIIIDSSSTPLDQSAAFNDYFISTIFPKSTLIYKHTRPGLTYQRNRGIEAATQDILYFFDDDVVLENTYLKSMNSIFAIHPYYAGGMGTIINLPRPFKKNWHYYFRTFFLLQRDYAQGIFTASGMPTHAYGIQHFKNVQVLGGCCMAFKASIVKNYLFDEKLSGYGYMEDCDIARRISQKELLFYNPYAKLSHFASPANRDTIVDNKAMLIKNYSYLFFKNFYPHNRLKIFAYIWTILGLFIEAILFRKISYLKGYMKGLKQYHFTHSNTY